MTIEATMTDTAPTVHYVLLVVGCAECRLDTSTEPLVEEVLHFDSLEAARQHVVDLGVHPSWHPHPLGGEFDGFGSGDYWIAPASLFERAGSETIREGG